MIGFISANPSLAGTAVPILLHPVRLLQARNGRTQNQAFNALLFFCREVLGQTIGNADALRAQQPVHERHAPTKTETQSLLQTVGNEGGYPTNLVARLLYGCGLRVTEPLNLRIKDIDLQRRTLCIRGAKGGKDRVVVLPASLIPEFTSAGRTSLWKNGPRVMPCL